MMWIISILIITLVLCILKDTHVKVYYSYYEPTKLLKEYDIRLQVWMVLITIILGLLPVINIILFIIFIVYYVVHVVWDPDMNDGYTKVFSIKGKNVITKYLLVIKNLLCKKI